jgi:hypothetical protein
MTGLTGQVLGPGPFLARWAVDPRICLTKTLEFSEHDDPSDAG